MGEVMVGVSHPRLPKNSPTPGEEPRRIYPSVTNRLSALKLETQQLSQARKLGFSTPCSVCSTQARTVTCVSFFLAKL